MSCSPCRQASGLPAGHIPSCVQKHCGFEHLRPTQVSVELRPSGPCIFTAYVTRRTLSHLASPELRNLLSMNSRPRRLAAATLRAATPGFLSRFPRRWTELASALMPIFTRRHDVNQWRDPLPRWLLLLSDSMTLPRISFGFVLPLRQIPPCI